MANFADPFWGEPTRVFYIGKTKWANKWGQPLIGVWGGQVEGLQVVVRRTGGSLKVFQTDKVANITKYIVPDDLKDYEVLDIKVGDSFGNHTWDSATVRMLDDNRALLGQGNSDFVYPYNDGIIGLEQVGRGGRHYGYLMMHNIHGLCVHITASVNSGKINDEAFARNIVNDWDNRGVNAHFIITQTGRVYQAIALCYQSTAQEEGNPFWISVELEGAPDNQGKNGIVTKIQIDRCRELFGRLANRYRFPPQLASPYVGNICRVTSPTVVKDYAEIGNSFQREFGVLATTDRSVCNFSRGLSCHYWIHEKVCPGYELLQQLPEIVKGASNFNDWERN